MPGRMFALACIPTLTACGSLPSLDSRPPSSVIAHTEGTRLGTKIVPLVAQHPGKSGVYPLRDARDAFAARVLLIRAAQRSVDAQYYIWRNDMTGTLLFDALRDAADRGVRVRLLLDDNNTSGLDPLLAALDAHPNIEVRLFNPFPNRAFRWTGYLTDFARLNRRMHNKSLTVDDQATIVGGRNIGDEYFGATDDLLFADLDLLAIGPVVDAVSADFDRYWASGSAYPVRGLLAPVAAAEVQELEQAARQVERNPAAQAYVKAMKESPFVQELIEGHLPLEWAVTRMVSDDPAKGLGRAKPERMLPDQLKEAVGEPQHEVKLVSPYFVPTATGLALFTSLAQRGVKIAVLTNALEATDVMAVHAGYARRREALLRAGITLYELKRLAPITMRRRARGARVGSGGSGIGGSSSRSSLHAKTFAVDGARVFVGSFNFDPRSASLNTEMGFVVESAALAQQIDDAFRTSIPENAYEVRMDTDGKLYWIERENGSVRRYEVEPGTSFWQRIEVFLMSLLPIDWLL